MTTHSSLRIFSFIALFGLGIVAVKYFDPVATVESPQHSAPVLPPIPAFAGGDFEPLVLSQLADAHAAASRQPNSINANGGLGMVLHAYELFAGAEVAYRRVSLLAPQTFRWHYYLGTVLAINGNYSEARASLLRALTLRPGDPPTRYALAKLALDRGEAREALSGYQTLEQDQAGSAYIDYGLGQAFAALDDSESAHRHYQAAVSAAPEFGAAHYALALSFRNLGDKKQAELHQRLYLRHRNDRPPRTDPLLAAIQKLNRGARGRASYGKQLLVAGRLPEAAQAFEESLAQDPTYVAAAASLVYIYWQLGKVEQAEQHYRRAVELEPGFAQAHINFGLLRGGNGRFAESAAAFEQALAVDPDSAFVLTLLGYAVEKQGQIAAATEYYRQALAVEPNQQRGNYLLGYQLLREGKLTDAELLFAIALSGEVSQRPWFGHQIGRAYVEIDDSKTARRYFNDAHEAAIAQKQPALVEAIMADIERLGVALK